MLQFATAGPDRLDCAADNDYWTELRRTLALSDRKVKARREARDRRDKQIIDEYKKRLTTIRQLQDALAVAVADDNEIARLNQQDTPAGMGQNAENILEVSRALGVATEVRGAKPAYTTDPDDRYVRDDPNSIQRQLRSRIPLVSLHDRDDHGNLKLDISDERKYDPAIMMENEDDKKYWRRLRLQSRTEADSQLVLDVTGWVIARPVNEGVNFSNHPITDDVVRLPPAGYTMIWPSAVRFMDVADEGQETVTFDIWERNYNMGQDMLPCREPFSGLTIVGESDGYKMPSPILDNSRIVTETNAKLRLQLRQGKVKRSKRNFDLQQELAKALAKKQVQLDRDIEALDATVEHYRIPQKDVEMNFIEMLIDLEARRRARMAAYYAAK